MFRKLKRLFASKYVAPGDGPPCPKCRQNTELVEVGSYRGKCLCKKCFRHYAIEK